MATRKNFPDRSTKRQQGALARRTKDVDKHNAFLHDHKDLTGELAKGKLDRAKSDVEALKAKLGLK